MKTVEIILNNKERIILLAVPAIAKNFTLINSHSYFFSPRIEHSIGGVDLPYTKEKGISELLGTYIPSEQRGKEIDFPVLEEWVESFMLHVGTVRAERQGAVSKLVYNNYLDAQVAYLAKETSFASLLEAKSKEVYPADLMPEKFVVIKTKK